MNEWERRGFFWSPVKSRRSDGIGKSAICNSMVKTEQESSVDAKARGKVGCRWLFAWSQYVLTDCYSLQE